MAADDRETKHNMLLRKLCGHLAQVYSKHIEEFNPTLTKHKAKLIKNKPSQSFKPFERCGYKIIDRPSIQLFKQPEENMSKTSKMLKKSSKLTNIKKRNLKTYKVSNLYFDPDGDSMKRYRELYTFKNSPGIRTVTNIQEAVKIYNHILQKARARKIFLGRRKKRREERLFLESQVNNIIDDIPSSNVYRDRNSQIKDFLERPSVTKHSLDDVSLTHQKKQQKSLYPSKDFLERNKLRKPKVKTFDECEDLTKVISFTKFPLLPSQEFLNRNMPKKSSDEVEFFRDEYLLRVKTPNSKKLLPVPVVKIGFQDDLTFSNSRFDPYSQKGQAKDMILKNKYLLKDSFLSQIKMYDKFDLDKRNYVSTIFDEQKRSSEKTVKPDCHIVPEMYLERLDRSLMSNRSSSCTRSGSVSVVNVGFQHERKPFVYGDLEGGKGKKRDGFLSLFKPAKEVNWDHISANEDRPLRNSNRRSYSLRNLSEIEEDGIKISTSSVISKHCYLDKMDNQAQWKRMQMSLEALKDTKYNRNQLKEKIGTLERFTLPDKFKLPFNK